MKVIHLNESKFNKILEEKNELPFQTFYEEVLKFIKGLLNDPIGTKPSEILRSHGLHNGILRKKLLDYGVITKDEDIREPYDETDGNQESRYYVSYKVPRENFKDKLRRLHNSLTTIEEAHHASMGVISDENALEYVKQATDIYNNKLKNRKK